jgi:hypothetical protein
MPKVAITTAAGERKILQDDEWQLLRQREREQRQLQQQKLQQERLLNRRAPLPSRADPYDFDAHERAHSAPPPRQKKTLNLHGAQVTPT